MSEPEKVCPLCQRRMEIVNEPVDTSLPLIPKEHWRCLCGHTDALYTVRDEA